MAQLGRSFPIRPHLPGPLAAPTGGYPVAPGTFVGLVPAERIRRRRYLYAPIVAPPVVAPQGGYPVASGTFVGLGPAERIRRRRYLGTVIVAPPVLATPFIAPAATIVSSHFLRRPRRGVPQTILPPPIAFAPFIPPRAFIAGQDAVERLRRRRFPGSTLLPPPIRGLQPVQAGTFLYQAAERAPTRRTVPKPHLAPPVPPFTAPQPLVVSQARQRALLGRDGAVARTRWTAQSAPLAPAVIVSQAVRRPYVGRTVPKPHLAVAVPPVVGFIAPPATVLTDQSVQRVLSRRTVSAPHLPPRVTTPAGPGATIKLAVQYRALVKREGRIHLPHLGAPPPVPVGTFVSQALRRPYVGRTVPGPHLVGAVKPSTFIAPSGLFVYQAVERSVRRRSGSVRLPTRGARTPFPPGTFLLQAVERAPTRRSVPPPHIAPPVLPAPAIAVLIVSNTVFHAPGPDKRYLRVQKPRLAPPVTAKVPFVAPPAFVISQTLERGWESRFRTAPEPHLASPVRTPAGPGATIKLQSLARQLRRREGRILLPKLGAQPPVPDGTFVSQALRRPYVGRTVPGPHLAPVVKPFAFVAPLGLFVYQATERGVRRRYGSVRLPSLGSPRPVPTGEFSYQAIRRSYVGRGPNPKPRLAPPVVATTPFLAPSALVVSQAVERGYGSRLRSVPKPHLAPAGLAQAGPGATVKLQSLARQLIRREGRVHLPSLGTATPVPVGTFLSQARQRPYVGRKLPQAARVAPPVVTQQTFPPNAPGTFVNQAVKRGSTLLSRRGHVRLAPPVTTAGRRIPTLVVSQSLQRPYVGRRVIPPHLAPPVKTKAGPGASLHYQAVQRPLRGRSVPLHPHLAKSLVKPPPAPTSTFPLIVGQALRRPYVGRKVPPSPSLRYHPILFVPSQPSVPFPGIATIGVTTPSERFGTVGPAPQTGTVDPPKQTGTVGPTPQTGTVDPNTRQGKVGR